MKQETVSNYIKFGIALQKLILFDQKHTNQFGGVQDTIKSILDYIDSYNLSVCKETNSYKSLRRVHKKILAEFEEDPKGISSLIKDYPIAEWTVDSIRESSKELSEIIIAEFWDSEVFKLESKMLPIKNLSKADLNLLFTKSVLGILDDVSKHDLSEAAHCLACERPTACAFHLLRAIEYLVKRVSHEKYKVDISKAKDWGRLIDAIQRHAEAQNDSPEKEFLINFATEMNFVKNHYRNKTNHPEKFYSVEEVQYLWYRCANLLYVLSKGE